MGWVRETLSLDVLEVKALYPVLAEWVAADFPRGEEGGGNGGRRCFRKDVGKAVRGESFTPPYLFYLWHVRCFVVWMGRPQQ